MAAQQHGSEISLFSCLKDACFTFENDQTECEAMKQVKSGLFSLIRDHDKPYLIKMREAYVTANDELKHLVLEQMWVLEYFKNLRGEISDEKTRHAQAEFMRIARAQKDCVRRLEMSTDIISRSIDNENRKNECRESWDTAIKKLVSELNTEHEEIMSCEILKAFEAKQRQEMDIQQARLKAEQLQNNQSGYLSWAYKRFTSMTPTWLAGSTDQVGVSATLKI